MTRLVPFPRLRDNHALHMLSPVRQIIDFALPPRCGECGARVDSDQRFCGRCSTLLDFLTRAQSALCNVPFKAVAGSVCGTSLESLPRHDGGRAALAYGAVALRLKYGRWTGLVCTMASIMAQQVDAAGIAVPVPLRR
ncbi:MAG: double zinc ribbon domain-containing protein [Sphingomonas sp.]